MKITMPRLDRRGIVYVHRTGVASSPRNPHEHWVSAFGMPKRVPNRGFRVLNDLQRGWSGINFHKQSTKYMYAIGAK